MPYEARHCRWCGQKKFYPMGVEEIKFSMTLPRGCCAPDGDGHLWVDDDPDHPMQLQLDGTLKEIAR